MAAGLAALLDDIAAIARVAAASVDDISAAAGRASMKAAGVVVDDAAVTPRYVTGFDPTRELPIIKKIGLGSLCNKLLFIVPAALLLSQYADWLLTPILMLGGSAWGTTTRRTTSPWSSRAPSRSRRWWRARSAPTSSSPRRSW